MPLPQSYSPHMRVSQSVTDCTLMPFLSEPFKVSRPSDLPLAATTRGGLVASAIGLVVGLAAALGLSRYWSTLLYEIQPTDPWTFAGVGTTLLAVTLLATWLPARRATLIDPAVALKKD